MIKKIFLTAFPKKKGLSTNDILYQLIHNDINIFCSFEHRTIKGIETECNNFVDLPLNNDILNWIYAKDSWTGNTFKMPVQSTLPHEDKLIDVYRDVDFNIDITIRIEDLFVFEAELLSFEEGLDIAEFELSEIGYKNLYKLIWVLKDMLIDDDIERNYYFPIKRKFKSAAQLIQQIEHYNLPGLGKRTLENHFKEANDVIEPLKTKFTKK